MLNFVLNALRDARSEIRLLKIDPGGAEDPLSCSLQTFNLSSLPPYEAVSYTWGDNTAKKSIQINGRYFLTFVNAYESLIELRYPVSSRVLWIDAICINQHDLKEKEQQILLMKTVYQNASRVVVWLPEPRGDADLAVGMLNELHAWYDKGAMTAQSVWKLYQSQTMSPGLAALRDVLHHPCWSRVWTLQEAVMGPELVIQLGRHTILWERMYILGDDNTLLYRLFITKPGEGLYSEFGLPQGCGAIRIIRELRDKFMKGREISLLYLLPLCKWRKATNTRDCIFGLCALSNTDKLNLRPDYTSTDQEVLTNAAQKLLLRYESFELFGMAGCGFDRNLSGLPSYVPDWSKPNAAPPLYHYFQKGSQDLAPKGTKISLHYSGKLQINLFNLDRIERVSKPLTGAGDINESQLKLSWFNIAEQMAISGSLDPYPLMASSRASIPLFEAFWRTTVANSTLKRTRAPKDWFHGYLRYMLQLSVVCETKPICLFPSFEEHLDLYSDPTDPTWHIMMEWSEMMAHTSWEHSFCITQNGLIGLVPPGALPGDIVCLIPGGVIPYIMRPKGSSSSSDECELVGESYIHGIMAADAIEDCRRERMDPQTVFLV